MIKRILYFSYGTTVYALFFATFLYAIGFIGNLLVPVSIDGTPQVPLWQALAIDILLLGVFAIQHSVMARPAFKHWWTRIVPKPIERSTYVLFSSVALIALFSYWQPIGGVIWSVTDPAGQAVLYGVFALGWGVVLVSTFLINHFDLFGLRQVWLYLIGKQYTPLPFKTPFFYRYVRHPLYVGWFLAFWATPTMTLTHLVFAIATTAYILIAIQLEERDLVEVHPEYTGYRQQVPMLVPRFTLGQSSQSAA
jgi:protein-S-isoprenylcysteine O-methyltransferase Ste14